MLPAAADRSLSATCHRRSLPGSVEHKKTVGQRFRASMGHYRGLENTLRCRDSALRYPSGLSPGAHSATHSAIATQHSDNHPRGPRLAFKWHRRNPAASHRQWLLAATRECTRGFALVSIVTGSGNGAVLPHLPHLAHEWECRRPNRHVNSYPEPCAHPALRWTRPVGWLPREGAGELMSTTRLLAMTCRTGHLIGINTSWLIASRFRHHKH